MSIHSFFVWAWATFIQKLDKKSCVKQILQELELLVHLCLFSQFLEHNRHVKALVVSVALQGAMVSRDSWGHQ